MLALSRMKNPQVLGLVGAFVLVLGLFSFAGNAGAASRVRGYYKPSTGSYVAPHYRTSPNRSRFDNYSAKGNYNPYTGKSGTVDPLRFYYRW